MPGNIILQRIRIWWYLYRPLWLPMVAIMILWILFSVAVDDVGSIIHFIVPVYGEMLSNSKVYCVIMIILFQSAIFMYVPDLLAPAKTLVSRITVFAIILLFIIMEINMLQHFQIKFMLGL
jgi:hypothetical protein